MTYINHDSIESVSSEAFQTQQPYPWAHMQDTLTAEGWDKLRTALPDMAQFDRSVGARRRYKQAPHDRGILQYREGMALAEPWKAFIAELHTKTYDAFLRRMLGLEPDQEIILTMEWYYAWQGSSVSPHCDAHHKIATHVFFFATDEDWPREWGGDILIFDDEGRHQANSAPHFDELKVAASLDLRKNASLLFERTDHSWHGVRPLRSPHPDVYRKLFIVTVNIPTLQVRLQARHPEIYRKLYNATVSIRTFQGYWQRVLGLA